MEGRHVPRRIKNLAEAVTGQRRPLSWMLSREHLKEKYTGSIDDSPDPVSYVVS